MLLSFFNSLSSVLFYVCWLIHLFIVNNKASRSAQPSAWSYWSHLLHSLFPIAVQPSWMASNLHLRQNPSLLERALFFSFFFRFTYLFIFCLTSKKAACGSSQAEGLRTGIKPIPSSNNARPVTARSTENSNIHQFFLTKKLDVAHLSNSTIQYFPYIINCNSGDKISGMIFKLLACLANSLNLFSSSVPCICWDLKT